MSTTDDSDHFSSILKKEQKHQYSILMSSAVNTSESLKVVNP